MITYPEAQCIYGLFAYIYWHLRILTPSIQEPGLHNTALSPTMSAPMGAHNYTYRGYNCTYNSSYAFMFGHCPIYLHSKRSAQGPAHILLYGMDVATAVFLTPKYRYRGLGGLFTRLLRWDGSQQCQHHHFPNECHHRCEFFLSAEQVVSLGVEKEKQGVPRSKDENEDEDDECNQCFELSKSCFLL